jgi:hypothetical protein
MKKKVIIDLYTFLANGVRISALANPATRSSFIAFFRAIKRIADPILQELRDSIVPPLDQATDEVRTQVLEEEITDQLPQIEEEYLLETLAESKIDAPLNAVLEAFDPFIKKQ